MGRLSAFLQHIPVDALNVPRAVLDIARSHDPGTAQANIMPAVGNGYHLAQWAMLNWMATKLIVKRIDALKKRRLLNQVVWQHGFNLDVVSLEQPRRSADYIVGLETSEARRPANSFFRIRND